MQGSVDECNEYDVGVRIGRMRLRVELSWMRRASVGTLAIISSHIQVALLVSTGEERTFGDKAPTNFAVFGTMCRCERFVCLPAPPSPSPPSPPLSRFCAFIRYKPSSPGGENSGCPQSVSM